MTYADELVCRDFIDARLKVANQWVFTRWPRPDHPPFRGCAEAANRLLRPFPEPLRVLVMRDQSLRPVREAVLVLGHTLLVPDRYGSPAYAIPKSALGAGRVTRPGVLALSPLPRGSYRYLGPADVVVVGCLAFDPRCRRLYSFDAERTAAALESLREPESGLLLPADTPVVAVAADEQEVNNWPGGALGFVEADAVVTPTRVIPLGRECSRGASQPADADVKSADTREGP